MNVDNVDSISDELKEDSKIIQDEEVVDMKLV
jgi:hypothetical protein